MKNLTFNPLIIFFALFLFSCGSNADSGEEDIIDQDGISQSNDCLTSPRELIENEILGMLADDFDSDKNKMKIDYNCDQISIPGEVNQQADCIDTNAFTIYWKSIELFTYYIHEADQDYVLEDTFGYSVSINTGYRYEFDPMKSFEEDFSPTTFNDEVSNEERLESIPISYYYSGDDPKSILDLVRLYELKNIGDRAAWLGSGALYVLTGNELVSIKSNISKSGSHVENAQYAIKIYDFLKNCGELPK